MKVQVFKYDISGGMAQQMSMMFLGFQLEAIWHTSIVIDNVEFYFDGGVGVAAVSPAGTTRFGRPKKVDDMGDAPGKTVAEFRGWVASPAVTARFGPNDYSLLNNNCNNFSAEAVKFLFNNTKQLDDDVLNMIPKILSTPLGNMIRPMLEQMTSDNQAVQAMQQAAANQQRAAAAGGGVNNPFMPVQQGTASAASSSSQQQQQQQAQATTTTTTTTTTAVHFDEDKWDKVVQKITGDKASAALPSVSWIESILSSPSAKTGTFSPQHSGSNAPALDQELLLALGFRADQQASSTSYRFRGDGDCLETAQMVVQSLLSDLESRWSLEAAATQ